MPDILVTETLARRAREAARAASGAKPGHLAEAIAAGLGYGSHAAFLADLKDAPLAEVSRPWTEVDAASRFAEIASDPNWERALAAAGAVLAAGHAGALERIAGYVRRVSFDGGGTVAFHEEDGLAKVWVSCVGVDRYVFGEAYPGLSLADLAAELRAATDPASLEPFQDGSVHGPLRGHLIGLPRDNVPGRFYLIALDGEPAGVALTAPPAMGVHAGLEAGGYDGETIRAIRPVQDATPRLRVVSGVSAKDAITLARLAANEAADGIDVVELGGWGDPPLVGTTAEIEAGGYWPSENERVLDGLRTAGLEGRVIVFPPLECIWEGEFAARIAERGASVWAPLVAPDAEAARGLLREYRIDPDSCRIVVQAPRSPRGTGRGR